MARSVDRAWEAVIEALFELDPEDRAAWLPVLQDNLNILPETFAEWDAADEKEESDGQV